jgi:hypothetical protein
MIPRTITKVSPVTGKENSLTIYAPQEGWDAYDAGQLIQRALPHLDADTREFMISGCTAADWDKLYPPEEEAGDEPAF